MIPTYEKIMLPLLKFLGDSKEHTSREAIDYLAKEFELTEEERKEFLRSGAQSVFDNRVRWASTYLYKAGLIDKPRRGVWIITERGKEVLNEKPDNITSQFLIRYEEFKKFYTMSRTREEVEDERQDEFTPEEKIMSSVRIINERVKSDLLQKIINQSPEFFERLVIDLIVKMGYGGSFEELAQHLGKSRDEGLDGLIKEDLLGFDNIYLQAKRWKDSPVGRRELQSFVGALHGRGCRKGIFITTSNFTRDAIEYVENIRDIKIVLIDQDKLLDYMLRFNLGVSIDKPIEIKKIDEDYFIED